MSSQFKTWSDGNVLTSADVNSYLMKQAVIVCDTSADYPASPVEGMLVYDKALDCYLGRTASAWVRLAALTSTAVQTWTPTVTQSATISGITVNEARYVRQGSVVTAWCSFTKASGAAGTAGNALTVSLPVTGSGHTALTEIGSGAFVADYAGTASDYQEPVAVIINTGLASVSFRTSIGPVGRWGVAPNSAIDVGDTWTFQVTYTV
jgi:hypothetical protein